MFLNISNHPSAAWQSKQLAAAMEYGGIQDLPFPQISADLSPEDIRMIASEYLTKIEELHPKAIFLVGEFSFTYMMVGELQERGFLVLTASSERVTEEITSEDGSVEKTARFDFVRFREYEKYKLNSMESKE